MHRVYIFFLLFLCATRLHAQVYDESRFDRYTSGAGMTDNVVTGVAQDATGYIWISTPSGLNRFNGSRFVQFHSNSDSHSLASEEISNMAWIDGERLAVFNAGLHIINTRTGERRNLFIPYHDKQYQYKFNMVQGVLGDKDSNLYVLTRSGLYHYDKNYTLQFRFDYYKEEEVPVTHFFFGGELFELDKNRLLILSADGLYQYDKAQKHMKKMRPADCPLLAGYLSYPATPYKFFQTTPGRFVVLKASSDSLAYIDLVSNRKKITRLPFDPGITEFAWRSRLFPINDSAFCITGHVSGFYKLVLHHSSGSMEMYPQKYFPAYQCSSLLIDKEKNLWVATNKGLYHQNPQRAQVEVMVLPSAVEDRFPNTRLEDVYVSRDKVYAGARGDAGIFRFDKKDMRLEKQFLFQKDDGSSSVRGIALVGPSSALLATNGPLMLFDLNSGIGKKWLPQGWVEGDWASDVFKDHLGQVWVSSSHLFRYHPLTQTFDTVPDLARLLSMPAAQAEDTSGNIWLAGHGVARYNRKLSNYDILLDSFPFIKMPDKQVNALVVDGQNTVWFNSNNNGLSGYSIATKTFRHFTRSSGLPDDNIASLMVLHDRLWIACYSGIACMDLKTGQITSFTREDGFPEMPIIKGAKFFYDSTAQQMYICFSNAIARFHPDEILKKKMAPRTYIESLDIEGDHSSYLPGEHITTSWKHNDIRISIGTINFSDGNNQLYAYRLLKDSNSAWTLLGHEPSFSISNLSPGTHIIQVKAYAPNNRWPEQVKEISVFVTPPFWRKTGFIVLMIVLLLVLIYLVIKWRTGVVRKKEMQKTHLEKLKADDYKNQFELQQITNYFSSSLADKKTEEEVLWDVAANLIGQMNYEDCMIYMWNKDRTKMVQKAAYGPKGKPEFIASQVFDVLPGQGIVGHVMKTSQPLLVNDTRSDERYRVDDKFRLSEVCVPIIHNDELLGAIDSEHPRANYFSERDIKILTTIATLIGNKLKQIESEQSLDAKRKELAGINEQLAEARLSALQAQMNPHFVFNALNSIKRMILDSDNEKASRYLSKFALMIRMTLNHSKEVFVTLDENIAYIKAYLEMEQLRFDDSFTYSIFTSDNIDAGEIPIPSMMIQPLVENAIWHGLMQAKGEKKIRISFIEEGNRLTCIVEDNGIGIRASEQQKSRNRAAHQSVGLENLQKRIKIMNDKYNMQCTISITDLGVSGLSQSGTRVVMQLNLINV